jgi:hypothetical protein
VQIRYAGAWLPLVVLVMGTFGCLHQNTAREHVVEFNGVLLDGRTNKPISGLEVEVRSGDRVVYNGETDGNGAIHFTHTFGGEHRKPIADGETTPVNGLTVLFHVDAGDYGVLEIPVRLIHGSDEGSLGELRLVPKEGP